MKSLRYLNTMLTLIAVLLTLNVWTLWTITPGGHALSVATEVQAAGLTNAAQQRKEMVDALKKINADTTKVKSMLEGGSARVRMEAGSSK
jgi:hypothetical protein